MIAPLVLDQGSRRWALANLIGMALFLTVASLFWIERELADVVGANIGSAFGWMLFAMPIALLFLTGNIAAAILGIVRGCRGSGWQPLPLAGMLLLLWQVVLLIDNSRHGA